MPISTRVAGPTYQNEMEYEFPFRFKLSRNKENNAIVIMPLIRRNSYPEELRCGCKYGASKPNCISLDGMAYHIHFHRLWLQDQTIKQIYYKKLHILTSRKINTHHRHIKNKMLTLTSPPTRASDARSRASTIFFISRCSLLWKSLNIVEPPDNTIFWE